VKGYDLATFDVSAEVLEDSLLLGCDTVLLGDIRRFRKIVASLSLKCTPLNSALPCQTIKTLQFIPSFAWRD
jgi:hypothetical protein